MSDQPQLVLFDADQIAGYVFDSGRLKEIRGGSYLLRVLTEETNIRELAEDIDPAANVIFAGGGAGMVRFAGEQTADGFIAALQQCFRQRTVSATVTAVRQPYGGRFVDAVEQGQIKLRRQKSAHPQVDGQFIANPYTAICVSCGRRPQVGSYQTAGERFEELCRTCVTRRRADDGIHEWDRNRQGETPPDLELAVTLGSRAVRGDPLAQRLRQRKPAGGSRGLLANIERALWTGL